MMVVMVMGRQSKRVHESVLHPFLAAVEKARTRPRSLTEQAMVGNQMDFLDMVDLNPPRDVPW